MAAEVLIIGGGTMGLATAWVLARRGIASTVLERFEHVHDRGSHSGFTRIIRQAYHEGSGYVSLVRDADRMWCELEARCGASLLVRAGLLEFGPPEHPEYTAALQACREHEIPHERFDAAEARRRWPFELPDGWEATFTASGGYLRVEACLNALRDEAVAGGATFEYGCRVVRLDLDGARPVAVLEDGRRIEGDRVVVTAGFGLPDLLPDLLPGRCVRLRRVLAWVDPAPQHRERLASLPVWAAFTPDGFVYGFPLGNEGIAGLKLACHTTPGHELDRPVDPETMDRVVADSDLDVLRQFVREHFRAADGPFVATTTCIYTCTPAWDFVVDRLPGRSDVVVAGGFSGHGFKFAPAVGELCAALLLEPHAVARPEFRVDRHREGPLWTEALDRR